MNPKARTFTILFLCAMLIIGVLAALNVSALSDSVKVSSSITQALESSDNVRVIVKMKDRTGFRALSASSDVPIDSSKIKNHYSSFNGFSATISKADLEALQNDNDIEGIYYDAPLHIMDFESNSIIGANQTWNGQIQSTNITGLGQTICIIDTGINYSHPDLGGGFGNKVIAQACYCSISGSPGCCKNGQITDTNASDDNGHGTHVAGIAAANGGINGVAPDTKLVSIKVCDSAGSCDGGDLISGIEFCTSNSSAYNISVISISIGDHRNSTTYCDSTQTPYSDAINAAVSKNITVVIASGNDGNTTGISSPACIQNATSVGSTTKADDISSFSNRGTILTVLAPGGTASTGASCTPSSPDSNEICSTSKNGGYISLAGTSMATPHVAGAVALLQQSRMLETGRKYTVDQVKTILKNNGKIIPDTYGNYSRINVFNSIDSFVAPNYTVVSTPGSANLSQIVVINVSATDNVGIVFYNITINSVQYQMSKSGDSYSYAYNASSVGSFLYNATFTDAAGKSNTTNTVTLNVGETIPPQHYNLTISMIYGSKFNATWIDNTNVSSVWAILNGNATVNYTAPQLSGNVYFLNLTLGAGNYSLQWFANDTFGNINQTSAFNATVNKAVPTVNLTFNLSSGLFNSNIYIDNGTSVNISAFTNGEGGLLVYLNGSVINQGNFISNLTVLNSTGTFNATAFYNSTQNYSSYSLVRFIYVGLSSDSPRVLKMLPTSDPFYTDSQSVTLKINATDSSLKNVTFSLYNQTSSLPNSTNATRFSLLSGMCNESAWSLGNLTEGSYSWNARACDNSNNCNLTSNFSFSVDLTNPSVSVTFSTSDSVTSGTSVTVICTSSDTNFQNVTMNNGGGTSTSADFEVTFTPTSSTTYSCTSYDKAGRYNTASRTLTVTSANSGSGSSSSSPSSSSTSLTSPISSYTYTIKTFESLTGGSTVIIDAFPKTEAVTGLQELSVSVKSTVSDLVQFKMDRASSSDVPVKITGNESVINYINIGHTGLDNSNIANAVLSFEFNKTFLDSNGYDKNSVKMKRYTTAWTDLPTKIAYENSSIVRYNATSPGLSFFVITAVKVENATSVNAQAATNEEMIQTASKSSIFGGVKNFFKDFKFTTNFWISVSVMGILIIGFAAFLLIKRRTRKDSFVPSGFD